MTTPMDDARAQIERCRQLIPEMVDLAEAVCLAVRVEPPLLRRARLRLCPRADAGVESALWFSRLVGSRSTGAIVLDGAVVSVLRETVSLRPVRWLEEARALVTICHAGDAEALRLEEEVVWLAVRDGAAAAPAIDAHLRRAVKTLVTMPDRAMEIARWADRALASVPVAVLEAPSATLLATGAAARLKSSSRLSRRVDWRRPSAGAAWVLPDAVRTRRRQIGIRLRVAHVEVTEPDAPLALRVAVPDQLDAIEVRWEGDAGKIVSRTLSIAPGEQVALGRPTGYLEIRTLDGRAVRVEAATGATPVLLPPQVERATKEWPVGVKRILADSLRHVAMRPDAGVTAGTQHLYRDPQHRCDIYYRIGSGPFQMRQVEVLEASEVRPKVFVSYARRDEEVAQRFTRAVRGVSRIAIGGTDDVEIEPGALWQQEIERSMLSATSIVILLSRAYLSSAETMEVELPTAMRLMHAGLARVLPIAIEQPLPGNLPEELTRLHITQLPAVFPEGGMRSTFAADFDLEPWIRQALLANVPSEEVRSAYLASVGTDMAEYRERLRRELVDHGYVVEMAEGGQGERRIKDARFRAAAVSIHLIGHRYAAAVEEELRAAVEESHADRECIVWVSPDADRETRQRELLQDLEARMGPHVQIVSGPFYSMREHVLDTLSPRRRGGAVRVPQESAPSVVIACDQPDVEDAARLATMLKELGAAPQFLGTTAGPSFLRRVVSAADGLIIYWGGARRAWVEKAIADAMRTVPSKPLVVYMAHPFSPEKDDLRSRAGSQFVVIDGLEESRRGDVAEFIQRLRDSPPSGAKPWR